MFEKWEKMAAIKSVASNRCDKTHVHPVKSTFPGQIGIYIYFTPPSSNLFASLLLNGPTLLNSVGQSAALRFIHSIHFGNLTSEHWCETTIHIIYTCLHSISETQSLSSNVILNHHLLPSSPVASTGHHHREPGSLQWDPADGWWVHSEKPEIISLGKCGISLGPVLSVPAALVLSISLFTDFIKSS